MRLKQSGVVGAVLFVCVGVADAGFFDSLASALTENKSIEQASNCKLSADEAYARSIELLSDGRQSDAEDLIKFAAKSHRDDVRILFAKAVLERSRWYKRSAEVWFAMARKAQGNAALSRAAWLSIKLDRHEAVEENMAELIRLSDENTDEIYLLWLTAIQCREQARTVETKKTMGARSRQRYEMLLEKFQLGPVMVHHTYANILAETLGVDYETALEHRILALSMEARGWTLHGLGNTLLSLEKNDWANAVWARAVRFDPRDADYWYGWGRALSVLKRYKQASEKFQQAVRLEPENTKFMWQNRNCLATLRKQEEKERERREKEGYEAAVEQTPSDPAKLNQLAAFLIHSNREEWRDYSRAIELANRSVEIKETSETFGILSEAYAKMKKHIEAVEAMDRRILLYQQESPGELVPKEWVEQRERFGFMNAVRKGHCYAIEYAEEQVELNPNDPKMLLRLGQLLTYDREPILPDYPRAIEFMKRSISIEEGRDELVFLAGVYYQNEQYAEAVAAMERSIELYWERNPNGKISRRHTERLEKYKKALNESREVN